jgi:cysteine desulfurase
MFKEIRELLGFGRIYLDFASGTPVDVEVEKVVVNLEKDFFANPSAIHHEGRTAHLMVEEARKSVARSLKVHGDEIIFTSGATESNNLCIGGILGGDTEAEVITTKVEHSAILAPLKKFSSKISFISLNESGDIDVESFKKLLNPNIKLVSVSLINSETGIVAPTREMSTIIKRYKESLNRGELDYPFFHIDGSQAPLVVSVERGRLKNS